MYLNNKPQKHYITPPTVQELFNIDGEMKERMDQLDIEHSTTVIEWGSSFTGHAMRVNNSSDIWLAYEKLRLMYAECDHVMLAYKVKNYSGHHDHGEFGASVKMLELLNQRGVNNIALFVMHRFGGIQLGPR